MKPMLASIAPSNLKDIQYPVAVEPKLDGVRCIAIKTNDKVVLHSRAMKTFTNFKELEEWCMENMQNGEVLDGEITSSSFDHLMHRTHALDGTNDDVEVAFNVFDRLTLEEWNAGLSDRPYHIRNPLHQVVSDHLQLSEYYNSCLENGYEGIMIKQLNGLYKAGRANYWLKMKPKDDMDMFVESVIEGKGKHIGRLGAIVCRLGDCTASVGTGFDDEMRKRLWERREWLIGKCVQVEYQQITKPNKKGDQSLRFPVFKCLRLDK